MLCVLVVAPAALAGCSIDDVVAVLEVGDGGADAAVDGGDATTPDAGSNIIFSDDFETCDYQRWSAEPGDYAAIERPGFEGSQCLSQHADSEVGVMGDSPMFVDFDPEDELWVRAWFRVNIELPIPGRGIEFLRVEASSTPGSFSLFIPESESQVFVGGIVGAGATNIELMTPFSPGNADNRGEWNCYEFHVVLNPPGSDGIVEFFVEGARQLRVEQDLRGSSTFQLEELQLLRSFDGSGQWPADASIQVDDIVVSGTRVGC